MIFQASAYDKFMIFESAINPVYVMSQSPQGISYTPWPSRGNLSLGFPTTDKIAKILRTHIRLAFKPQTSISSLIGNAKDKTSSEKQCV